MTCCCCDPIPTLTPSPEALAFFEVGGRVLLVIIAVSILLILVELYLEYGRKKRGEKK